MIVVNGDACLVNPRSGEAGSYRGQAYVSRFVVASGNAGWEVLMKTACWILLALSALLFVVGASSRLLGQWDTFGLAPGTYWRGAMGLVIYAIALKLLATERREIA